MQNNDPNKNTSRGPKPAYHELLKTDTYYGDLQTEFRQSTEEGLDLADYAEVFAAASRLPQGEVKKKIGDALFSAVCAAPQRKDFPYTEPSGYEEIVKLRKGDVSYCKKPDLAALGDKIYGAWIGRACGCMLGKSIEGIRSGELVPLLKETGNYPLHRYLKRSDFSEAIYAKYNYPLRERVYIDEVDGMPADDDMNYVVMAQMAIQRFGKQLTPFDICVVWQESQPRNAYYTAEQTAYCNFIKGYRPPDTARYQNPYREWIGAQIRGDYFGYIHAGDPQAAAEAAFRDASVSHVKNGIYGEMLISAMISVAAVEDDISAIIEKGLAQIPHTSRLYEAIASVLEDHRKGTPFGQVLQRVHAAYDEHTTHGWCHVIPNAMIVCAALLYGEGDYGRSICLAVGAAFDTDCNGATVGSVLGMRGGYGAIGDEWKKPIGDKLYTEIVKRPCVSIRDCAKKTVDHFFMK